MARKPRDYKAEERRRNELAQQRGFRTRAAQRGAIERGERPALAPQRLRSPRTKAAQQRFLSGLQGGSAIPRGPIPSYDEGVRNYSKDIRQANLDWQAKSGKTTVAAYDFDAKPKRRRDRKGRLLPKFDWEDANNATNDAKRKWIDKHGIDAYDRAYYDMFVSGPERYSENRHSGGSEAMYLWFVEITGYMDLDEYERRYGTRN